MNIEYKNESVMLNFFIGFGLLISHWITVPSFEHEKKLAFVESLIAKPRTQSVCPLRDEIY
jgi:hypothetical protein